MFYSWIFVGTKTTIKNSYLKLNFTIEPFKSLDKLIPFYLTLGIISVFVWGFGVYSLIGSTSCIKNESVLYNYSIFLMIIYWFAFFIVMMYMIKYNYHTNFAANIKKQIVQAATTDELEERIFKTTFNEYDVDREFKVAIENIPKLIQSLGVYVSDEEIKPLLEKLDRGSTGYVSYEIMYDWFKNVNSLEERNNN